MTGPNPSGTFVAVPGADGWVGLGPAEPPDRPGSDRATGDPLDGEVLAVLAHLSDLHVCDAESPARLEYLDAHGMPGAPFRSVLGDIGSYRPQELLTVPVAIAAVDAVNAMAAAPRTGHPLTAAVLTGDLIDNGQTNELDWYLGVVVGGSVRPSSGPPDRSEWVGAPTVQWNPSFWHPEGHRSGRVDRWRDEYGFPLVDGLLASSAGPFPSPGLRPPTFAVHGNHDLLLQGTVPADPALRALAVGRHRPTGLAPGQTPLAVLEATARCGPVRYVHRPDSPWEVVTADPRRALLDERTFRAVHAATTPGDRHDGPGNAYDARLGPSVRLIALDTVNPFGGWEGSLDRTQYEWLRRRLAQGSEPYVVVASHHPSWCLVNGWHPAGTDDRVLADEVLGCLLDHPRVVVWLSGHVHRPVVTVHERGARRLVELTCASLIDWPQQWQVVELVREAGGTIACAVTPVDHAAPPDPGVLGGGDHRALASWSRLLARNAPEARRRLDRTRVPQAAPAATVRIPDRTG